MTIYSIIKNKNRHIKVKELADKLGIARESMSRKLSGDYFTKGELQQIIEVMEFDSDDVLKMFC